MIVNSSPLESLAAFGLAFFGGLVCGLLLARYTAHIRADAVSALNTLSSLGPVPTA